MAGGVHVLSSQLDLVLGNSSVVFLLAHSNKNNEYLVLKSVILLSIQTNEVIPLSARTQCKTYRL